MSKENKKPFYKKKWFIALCVFIILWAIGSSISDNEKPKEVASDQTVSNTQDEKKPIEEAKKITYIQVDAGKMIKDLHDNALKAQKDYKNQYVEVTGEISNIDSSGDYISIEGVNSNFNLTSIMCYLQNDEQRDVVIESGKGNTVVIKGKVTDVGEVMGYSIDVDEIIAQ